MSEGEVPVIFVSEREGDYLRKRKKDGKDEGRRE